MTVTIILNCLKLIIDLVTIKFEIEILLIVLVLISTFLFALKKGLVLITMTFNLKLQNKSQNPLIAIGILFIGLNLLEQKPILIIIEEFLGLLFLTILLRLNNEHKMRRGFK